MTERHNLDAQKLAIVTGTTSGIGMRVAEVLLQRGWAVAGIARRASAIDHPQYQHSCVDLADLPSVTSSFESRIAPILVERPWQRIALVNNAASADLMTGVEDIDPLSLIRLYAINTASPMWLMGFLVRTAPHAAALRIVNVSSGAATAAFPGLAAYGSSKAALRMAGMVLAAELDSPLRSHIARSDAAILSYEPGVVDTPMQQVVRSNDPKTFPWVKMFRDLDTGGLLVDPEAPAIEIAAFLDGNAHARFSESRLRA